MRVEAHERDRRIATGPASGASAGRLTCGRCDHHHLSVSPRIAHELGVRCKRCGGALMLERLRCNDCGEPHAGIDAHAAMDAHVRCFRCLGELIWRAEGRFVRPRHEPGTSDAAAVNGAASEATPA